LRSRTAFAEAAGRSGESEGDGGDGRAILGGPVYAAGFADGVSLVCAGAAEGSGEPAATGGSAEVMGRDDAAGASAGD